MNIIDQVCYWTYENTVNPQAGRHLVMQPSVMRISFSYRRLRSLKPVLTCEGNQSKAYLVQLIELLITAC